MIKDLLESLKMKGALEALERLEGTLDRDSFVTALLQAECEDRDFRANKRRLANAKFPVDKEWSDIDSSLNPAIRFSDIKSLSRSDFISDRKNLCLMGQQGTSF